MEIPTKTNVFTNALEYKPSACRMFDIVKLKIPCPVWNHVVGFHAGTG